MIMFAFVFAAANDAAAKKTHSFNASSSKFYIVDGDTVHYGKLKFRLCGIQSPEKYAPRPYKMATRMLQTIIGKKRIRAHVVAIDKYNRKVAVLYAGGDNVVSVNEKMVRQGGAKHYRRFSENCIPHVRPAQFDAAEKIARKKRRGIWKR